jgi:glycosyltransferase involved in cell wall biosynthesis
MGRLVTTKGVHVLLQAAQRLRAKGLTFKLKIVGDGPERDELEAQVQTSELADRVSFLGYQPAERLREALSGVGAVVMPSLGGEVFGLVAAESMMRGVLPIVSDCGALAEVVGDAGLKFPPGDEEALAGCMEQVLKSPEFTTNGGLRAQERAMRSFTESRMVYEHLAVYQRLLAHGEDRC